MIILQTVADSTKGAIDKTRKSHVGFRLAFLYLDLAHFKGQSQGYAYFDCEYLVNDDR